MQLDIKQERELMGLLRDVTPLIFLIAEELSKACGSRATIKVARLVACFLQARAVPSVYTSTLRDLLAERARTVRDLRGRVWVLSIESRVKGGKPQGYRLVYTLDGNQL
jgi:hypothetical protein